MITERRSCSIKGLTESQGEGIRELLKRMKVLNKRDKQDKVSNMLGSVLRDTTNCLLSVGIKP